MENIQRVDTFERQAPSFAIQAELVQAASMLVKNRENLNRFQQDVAAHLPELKQMAEDAYLFSKSNLLELLDATRARNELTARQVWN
jgi:outer membrane protein, heavy metal efflux system